MACYAQAYVNDKRLEKGLKPSEYNDPDDKVLVGLI